MLPEGFSGNRSEIQKASWAEHPAGAPLAAVIRDKGTNGEREMAYSLHLAGFEVLDITTSDLVNGEADLSGVQFAVFPGGFSNSDVLGAGRGWAAALRYNEKASAALETFFSRSDTLSLGVCNGCQLVTELSLYVSRAGKPAIDGAERKREI